MNLSDFLFFTLLLTFLVLHKTKGIILRTIKYGETSVIAAVYTELFGLQSYIAKGIRKSTKKTSSKENYFQAAAILEMQVYNNELKNLQFIKEYQWSYLYQNIFFDVIKNSVAMYMIELFHHCTKQQETNNELYYFLEENLIALDNGINIFTANLPLFFTLHLASELGFKIHGAYSKATPVLDLQEGIYVSEMPAHNYYLNDEAAKIISEINKSHISTIENIQLKGKGRSELLIALQQYISLHIPEFIPLKSLAVLQQILN